MVIEARECPGYEVRVERLKTDINSWKDKLKDFINYSDGVDIIIKFLENKSSLGQIFYKEKIIELDPRFTLIQLRKTLIHELIHYEQYVDKRLQIKDGEWFWNGVSYENTLEYNNYKNLPWEKEARSRTKEIFLDVFG
jgi:hypothetical protein|tara:strand:- start:907 stop:1320 length:414 start_codon:yes stop_codon:yes gene_type:complete